MNDLLICLNVYKYFLDGNQKVSILKNINFSLKNRDMVAIIGNSGSGKSTLLHLLGGMDSPTSGEIIFEGKSFNRISSYEKILIRNQKIGFIYQSHFLLPDFSILENVAMPMLINKKYKILEIKNRVKKMLSNVGLEKIEHKYPSYLSGGEKQRVAIARALINYPKLVLADEPTGNLDQNNTSNIFELLINLNKNYKIAFLITTHDIELSRKFPKILEIKDGILI